MLAVAHDRSTTRKYAVDPGAAREYPPVEHIVVFTTDRVGAQRDDIGVPADTEPSGRPIQRQRPAMLRAVEQGAAGRSRGFAEDVARAMKQPLAVFQQPQLPRERNLDIRVGADAEPPASADEVGRVKRPSPRLASVIGHSPATAPLSANRR